MKRPKSPKKKVSWMLWFKNQKRWSLRKILFRKNQNQKRQLLKKLSKAQISSKLCNLIKNKLKSINWKKTNPNRLPKEKICWKKKILRKRKCINPSIFLKKENILMMRKYTNQSSYLNMNKNWVPKSNLRARAEAKMSQSLHQGPKPCQLCHKSTLCRKR